MEIPQDPLSPACATLSHGSLRLRHPEQGNPGGSARQPTNQPMKREGAPGGAAERRSAPSSAVGRFSPAAGAFRHVCSLGSAGDGLNHPGSRRPWEWTRRRWLWAQRSGTWAGGGKAARQKSGSGARQQRFCRSPPRLCLGPWDFQGSCEAAAATAAPLGSSTLPSPPRLLLLAPLGLLNHAGSSYRGRDSSPALRRLRVSVGSNFGLSFSSWQPSSRIPP